MRFRQFLKTLWQRMTSSRDGFLCDTCRYDYGHACTRPKRPNAKVCPDYKKGG